MISDAESIVMDALWQRHPQTAEEVVARLADEKEWSPPTVRTLLNRLLNKGAIAAERDGRRYLYRPLIDRDDYVSAQARSLVDRLFDGRISSLVTHFSERERLSGDEVAELKRLIAELDDDR
jgi:predicted transcriptional regulator